MNNLKTLENLIGIRSDTDCKEILEYISNQLKEYVKEIRYVKNEEDNKNNILIGLNTVLKDIEPVILSGHIDTVPADEEKYTSSPYSLIIKDDKAYGLGIIDMKCFTASVIDLIMDIKKYDYPIVLALTVDEETNLFGIKSIIKELKKLNIKPKFTIIGEPTNMKINSTSNGCFEYKVEVFGKSCHSSTPQLGINSICILSRIVTFIEDLNKKYTDLVMNCNIFNGGTIVNRIPDYACMHFDIRTININSYKDAIYCIERKIYELEKEYSVNISFNNILMIPPLTCKNKEIIKKLSTELYLENTKFNGGCEAGYYEEYSGEAILFGVGDLSLAHKPDEYMIIDNYKKYNNKLIELLDKLEEIYY